LGLFAIGCHKKDSPTSGSGGTTTSADTATDTPTPKPKATSTPTPAYGYVDVNFDGNSLQIFCNLNVYVDSNSIAYGMGSNSVCSKRLTAGAHTVEIQLTGGCPDGTSGRLYYTNSSNVTAYSTAWIWNLNVKSGQDYSYILSDYSSSFSACGATGMAYFIQADLLSSSSISCWQ
jgi:hypothetical protein